MQEASAINNIGQKECVLLQQVVQLVLQERALVGKVPYQVFSTHVVTGLLEY
jgi:hypothetical protein